LYGTVAQASDVADPSARPVPIVGLRVIAPQTLLQTGGTVALTVQGAFADGSNRDLTQDSGTIYQTLPEGIVSVVAGQVQALKPGQVLVVVTHEQIEEISASDK